MDFFFPSDIEKLIVSYLSLIEFFELRVISKQFRHNVDQVWSVPESSIEEKESFLFRVARRFTKHCCLCQDKRTLHFTSMTILESCSSPFDIRLFFQSFLLSSLCKRIFNGVDIEEINKKYTIRILGKESSKIKQKCNAMISCQLPKNN